ncbi:hypothetical protein K505DRAFT_341721 [Melanomma pulvis-pyrius CBS 109.77]|uniref:Uncharacterized protein n=1 Tax=Melanomma pulvis-pyrius CBS 109.77 TaxID=1314802 RepID=A0A6A6WY95_9PLEO|nr:hypothetical protein K505DRAFT_341721 [Melanomma pulvis-pyrius CBS 109.77]
MKSHIYIGNVGSGPTKFDNLTVVGASVIAKGSNGDSQIEPSLSWGHYTPPSASTVGENSQVPAAESHPLARTLIAAPPPPTASQLLPTASRPQPAVPRLPVAVPRLPVAVPRLPVAVPRLPVAVPRLPVAVPRLPPAVPRLPPAVPRLPLATSRPSPAASQPPPAASQPALATSRGASSSSPGISSYSHPAYYAPEGRWRRYNHDRKDWEWCDRPGS